MLDGTKGLFEFVLFERFCCVALLLARLLFAFVEVRAFFVSVEVEVSSTFLLKDTNSLRSDEEVARNLHVGHVPAC